MVLYQKVFLFVVYKICVEILQIETKMNSLITKIKIGILIVQWPKQIKVKSTRAKIRIKSTSKNNINLIN